MSVPPRSSSPFNLEFLRKDARRLLRSARAGDLPALERLRLALPRLASLDDRAARAVVKLADAQQAIAREHGHPNWAALTRDDNPLERFLVAVRGADLPQITRHLAEFAPLARTSVHAASALGDRAALAQHLDRDASAATTLHRDWPPLLYVCASPLNRLSTRHSAGLLECARLLLDSGVDSNTTIPAASDAAESAPVTAITRALKAANMPIMLLLQQRGSHMLPAIHGMLAGGEHQPWGDVFREYFQRPDVRARMRELIADTRGKFGGIHPDPRTLDLRTMHAPTGTGLPGMQHDVWAALLDRGYDATGRGTDGRTILHRIARTGPADFLEMLLTRGIDPNLRDGNGQSVMRTAIRAGHQDIVGVLQRHGAGDDDVRPIDRLLGACLRLAQDEARAIAAASPGLLREIEPEDYGVMILAASRNQVDVLRLMLDVGMPPGGFGASGSTALHQAAWNGLVDAVRLLVDKGAPVEVRDTTYDQRPIDWAAHGAVHCRDAADEYAAVVAALRAHGS
jgi:ankyrin repeat protein